MFNNILYFIVALFIIQVGQVYSRSDDHAFLALAMVFVTYALFALYCKKSCTFLLQRAMDSQGNEDLYSGEYQGLQTRLSVLAIFHLAVSVFFFGFQNWMAHLPGFETFSVLGGLAGLSLFFLDLCTIWYFSSPVHRAIFHIPLQRKAFVLSNLRFNVPILFPWIALSLAYDLLSQTPWAGPGSFLASTQGQVLFFACFVLVLMMFLPTIIQYWWGCQPLTASEKGLELERFLRERGFKYKGLLKWPILEGRMLTAGIMGIVPRHRYILVTDALIEALTVDELKAVLAHEMGHARYHHLLFYILFFVGFMAISFGLAEMLFYLAVAHPLLREAIMGDDTASTGLLTLITALPMLMGLLVYFRFVMGFFMRHFERQADLYSATAMGTPLLTISSLEKIALLSGRSRNVPSWHHFSIKQRVEFLLRVLQERGLAKRQNRLVLWAFFLYLTGMGALGYGVHFSPLQERLNFWLVESVLEEELARHPDDLLIALNLAMAYHRRGEEEKCLPLYEKILQLSPDEPLVLNNLAWLLVTSANESLRDPERGLALAKRAVAREPSSVFLDTLAEAYYVNGRIPEAIDTIRLALEKAQENRSYYAGQLRKFEEAQRN